MKLAAIAKLIKADGYCKLYKVFYDDCRTYVSKALQRKMTLRLILYAEFVHQPL